MSQKHGARPGRRDLFRLIGASGVSLAFPVRSRSRTTVQSGITFILDVSGTTPSTALIGDLLAPLLGRGIPLGWIHGELSDQRATQAALEVGRQAGDRLEIVPYGVGIVDRRPFFRMQAAYNAREEVDRLLTSAPGTAAARPVSIATDDPGEARSFDGVRTAGFRHVFRVPSETTPPDARGEDGRLSVISGGVVADLSATDHRLIDALAERIVSAPLLPVYLTLRNPGHQSQRALRAQMEALGQQVADWRREGSVFALLPSDYAVWTGESSAPMLVLRIAAPPDAEAGQAAAFETFTSMLRQAGIGFSVDRSAGQPPGAADGGCTVLAETAMAGPAGAPLRDAHDSRYCVVSPREGDGQLARLAAQGWEAALLPPGAASQGLDLNGLLRLPSSAVLSSERAEGPASLPLGDGADVFVVVTPSAYRTQAQRSNLIARLLAAARSVGTPWQGLPHFLSETRPEDPVFDMMQATRLPRPALIAPHSGAVGATERRGLVEDAERAWSYISETTIPRTGLCPSTVRFDRNSPSSYAMMTMWDIGSLLQAVLASRDIGLIDQSEFLVRTEAILEQLPNRRIGGLSLPSAAIPSNGVGPHDVAFDACDTGRLLSALRDVARVPGLDEQATEIVRAWDLAETVIDGHMHSSEGHRLRDRWWSHCTPYAARAYGLWGIDAASPYPRMTGASPALSQMGLLYQVAAIGSLGAEPLLLEPLELGPSEAGSYVIDVLCRAQADAFVRTGELYCVSESPIDEPPWFSYQGLNLNRSDDRWAINLVEADKGDATATRRQDLRAVVSKAAYLWAAIRPSDYSDRLVAYVRQRAALPRGGFASAIYVEDDRPTADYSDINTNGIILAAIAYILRGRRPRGPDDPPAADGPPI